MVYVFDYHTHGAPHESAPVFHGTWAAVCHERLALPTLVVARHRDPGPELGHGLPGYRLRGPDGVPPRVRRVNRILAWMRMEVRSGRHRRIEGAGSWIALTPRYAERVQRLTPVPAWQLTDLLDRAQSLYAAIG